jgi:hypothetical protein
MQHKITSCLLGTVTRCHCQREGWPGVLTSSKRDRRVARSGFIPCHTAFAVVRIFPIRSRVASAHAFKPLVGKTVANGTTRAVVSNGTGGGRRPC